MTNLNKIAIVAILSMAFAATGLAAAPDEPQEQAVLTKLDSTSLTFKSASADIVWNNVQTQPVPDEDSQVGTVQFERKGGQLSMALHFKTDNGKPVPKDVVYTDGVLKLYEPLVKTLTVSQAGPNRAEYDTFLSLGIGGSGKDLQKNWQVHYLGTEQLDGATTSKLELTPLHDDVKKNITKVLLWINMDNGIAVKQQLYDPTGNYREVIYHNVRVNTKVPSNAFTIKTPPDTKIVNH